MRIKKKHFFWGVPLFVISAVGLAGCAKTGSTYTTSPVTYVSLMNVAPYGPTADVYLNGQLATSNGGITSGSYSLKYGALQPGTYTIKFTKSGTQDSLTGIPGPQRLDTLNFYSLIIYNDTLRQMQSMLIHDDFTSISTTNANYRFFNLSPDAPKVNFYLNDKTAPAYSNRTPADNAVYGNYNGFLSTAPSNYSFVVKPSSGDTTAIATLPNVNLLGGNVYTIFLTGTMGNYKLNLLPASY